MSLSQEMMKMRKHAVQPLPLVAGALLALSMGAPQTSCIGVQSADMTSGTTGVATGFAQPNIVKRDNPAFGGNLDVHDPHVSATIKDPYLTDASWAGLSGHITLDEVRENQSHYINQSAPLEPRHAFKGPGTAQYGTRAGLLVHKNKYGMSLSASDRGGDTFSQPEQEYMQLDDHTLLVPIIVVNWSRTPGEPDPNWDPYQSFKAANMIDFNPLYLDDKFQPSGYVPGCVGNGCAGPQVTPRPLYEWNTLAAGEIDNNKSLNYQFPPDLDEPPPDDIWATCDIQFQVVTEVELTLPPGWHNACSKGGSNFPGVEATLRSKFSPSWAYYYLDKLQPIFLQYGDLESCPFWGNTAGIPSPHVEVHSHHGNGPGATTTSHELGHALGLDHAVIPGTTIPVEGNLMSTTSPNGGNVNGVAQSGWTTLGQDQCGVARGVAQNYSQRFDDFNYLTGRTYGTTAPPPPPPESSGDGSGPPPGTGSGGGSTSESCNQTADCPSGQECLDGTCWRKPS